MDFTGEDTREIHDMEAQGEIDNPIHSIIWYETRYKTRNTILITISLIAGLMMLKRCGNFSADIPMIPSSRPMIKVKGACEFLDFLLSSSAEINNVDRKGGTPFDEWLDWTLPDPSTKVSPARYMNSHIDKSS